MRNAVNQRIDALKATEGTVVKEEWSEDRAVLSAIRGDRMVECDFIESERSCRHPRRMDEYYEVLGQGIRLGIIVPDSFVGTERLRMRRIKGEGRLLIMGYSDGQDGSLA
ncbi:hypothetical protein AOA80_01485 [Methanomassiliicoccales archaeon RumEn M1]|nr:hypothetical protein AOA80_01485 [Methanomassiliicoccales archaeon RumEn M1]